MDYEEGESCWVIEHAATEAWLGTHTRAAGEATAEFGSRMPILCGDIRSARDTWRRYCRLVGYTVRGVSLPKEPKADKPGPNHGAKPKVVFRQVMIRPTLFAVEDK